MNVRPYDESKDFEEINNWAKQWGITCDKELLPPTGYIVPGVAAYFVYYTNSKAVWLENMVSNKEVPKELRELALQAIVTAILRDVNKAGCKVAYANTTNESVIKRALKHNATAEAGQTLLKLYFKPQ